MKKLIRILILLSVLLPVLSSCFAERSVTVRQAQNNKDYTVHYLFEHNGCKVYRFYDTWSSSYVYFTTQGDVTSIRDDSTHQRTATYSVLNDTIKVKKAE
ncbi:DUF4884 domain-containing protein [Bacteroides helcogenes]|uniref:DUF4884 domain-containing protein n=1 Tax=Bacteroides helcogenes (strain ATCC 35417 / DSM 20613 / JCM 6297 / CCUG 15421 / P 36-108) TaxID=693979 RepID=E6SNE2_BACT6|nr:DUF4884 domain-containing protein [Bacteroides helcogenes]ADV42735.1 hypothetical protein Bache_0712 [Bacteroides helcogenes P 36-108]MDY5239566.1 DUF4884 domain-containing protein [Bacteroides helcogenes]